MITPTFDETTHTRERLADLDHFDPNREQTDRYDRRDDDEGYGS